MIDQDHHQKAQRLRAGHAFKGAGGFSFGSGRPKPKHDNKHVLVRGAYRYHKGQKAQADAGGKMDAHIKYLAGDKHKQEEKEKRHLYDDRGRVQTSSQAADRHSDTFIEHRVLISPAAKESKVTEKDLHVLAQASIQEIRSKNPKAEVEASYATHMDTDKPHSHLLLTSKNNLRITKEDYAGLREMNRDLRIELEQERQMGREHSHTMDVALGHEQNNQNQIELEVGR